MWSINTKQTKKLLRVFICIENASFKDYLEFKLKLYPVNINFECRFLKFLRMYNITVEASIAGTVNLNMIHINQEFPIYYPCSSFFKKEVEQGQIKRVLEKWLKEEEQQFINTTYSYSTVL
ncbi:hypothetical protein [Viridibacillus arvi]|uniref:hypothetical protein n=1 Tax=Viridibacillus arvi TaxID=263475 RepID=UPI0034CDD5C9